MFIPYEFYNAFMVDFFLLLPLPGAGDEVQGMKKATVEMADLVAINKHAGDNRLFSFLNSNEGGIGQGTDFFTR